MMLRIWPFVMPAQAVLTDVDPVALVGTVDQPAMEQLETAPVDPSVLVRTVTDRGGRLPARREALVLVVRGMVRRTAGAGPGRRVIGVDGVLVVRWDVFFAPEMPGRVPRAERTRRARCRALVSSGPGRVAHRAAERRSAARIRAHRRAARFAALACAEGSA